VARRRSLTSMGGASQARSDERQDERAPAAALRLGEPGAPDIPGAATKSTRVSRPIAGKVMFIVTAPRIAPSAALGCLLIAGMGSVPFAIVAAHTWPDSGRQPVTMIVDDADGPQTLTIHSTVTLPP
jgi:hypothetical protein